MLMKVWNVRTSHKKVKSNKRVTYCFHEIGTLVDLYIITYNTSQIQNLSERAVLPIWCTEKDYEFLRSALILCSSGGCE